MSENKNISPLLDGFTLGTPMSEHDGVRCCPAIKENTEKKYIVKVITIPASQVQLDALLIAGAYKDPADAMEYYKRVGEDVMKEAQLLQKLSNLDGFLSYEGWQMEPITRRRLGFEIYLVGTYKRSLDKYVRRNPVTHLEAMNLGLDLCAALNICRQAGALYVDLKPSNIFVSDKKEYRIGDLGFIGLKALSYTTLPDKYRSVYTPPEAFDPMAPLNLTLDTYAVGMILYQLYNEGNLPFKEKAPDEPLPSPINADYELAEIILKAIHPDPEQRWQDPAEMGKALAAYMQRNRINDVPITPHIPLEVKKKRRKVKKAAAQKAESSLTSVPVAEEAVPEVPAESADSAQEAPSEEAVSVETSSSVASPSETENDIPEQIEPDTVPDMEDEDEPVDDSAPDEEDVEELLPHEMSEEMSRMMEKADDLIAHETPEGVVVPEMPEMPDPFAFIAEDSEDMDDSDIPQDPIMRDSEESQPKREHTRKFASQKGKQMLRKILASLLSLLIVACIVAAAFVFYKFFYLQTIDDIFISGSQEQLTVRVDTRADPALLMVTCTDQYGNAKRQPLTDGTAEFNRLVPNTTYTISLDIDGFHKLVGQTSELFTTDATTKILNFTAVTGSGDGSVMLAFTVDGEEPDKWTIRYQADGEKEHEKTFSGHSVTIDDLTVGKVYTFTLDAGRRLSLSGEYAIDFLASRLILAQDLTVTSNGNSDITVHWKAPGDVVVDNWEVRCYNDDDHEQKLTVSDTSVYLSGIDFNRSYTVEVTASGMTQPARTSITANPLNITSLEVEDDDPETLNVTWNFDGTEPEGGWLLMYSIDGGKTHSVVKCKTASAQIPQKIPNARYQFTIQTTDGTSVFNNMHSYSCPEAEGFNAHNLSYENVEGMLVKTPEDTYWHFGKLSSDAVSDTFARGESISIVLHASTDFYLPGAQRMDILYVIRDAYGNVIPELMAETTDYWKDLWYPGDYHYAELDVPNIPSAPGNYTLNLYFNGCFIAEVSFTITN